MPLIEYQLEQDIKNKINANLGSQIQDLCYDAMEDFQDMQKEVLVYGGVGSGQTGFFTVARKAASYAFANKMKDLKGIISDAVADAVAESVDDFVKSATIIVKPGIPVATAGSPAAQTGATTGPSTPATIT